MKHEYEMIWSPGSLVICIVNITKCSQHSARAMTRHLPVIDPTLCTPKKALNKVTSPSYVWTD